MAGVAGETCDSVKRVKRVKLTGILVTCGLLGGVACSSYEPSPPLDGAIDASTSSTRSSSSSSGAPVDTSCQGIRPTGAEITPTNEDGAPAAARGGTLTDGTYVLDRVRIYDSNPTVSWGGFKQVVTIAGPRYVRGYYVNAAITTTAGAVSGEYRIEGTRITRTVTCQEGASDDGSGPFQGDYTATANDLTLVQPSPYNADWITELHYQKQ